MKKFIIGYSRARSPFKIGSRVIQEVEKRDFSHAYVRYQCQTTNLWVVAQASHGYVNEVSYDIFKQDNVVIEEYKITCRECEWIDILTFIQQNKGKPYDRMALFCIAIKKLFRFELNVRNRDDKFICSEFAGRIMVIAKLENPKELDYETPSDLRELTHRLSLEREDVCVIL